MRPVINLKFGIKIAKFKYTSITFELYILCSYLIDLIEFVRLTKHLFETRTLLQG